MRRPLKPQVTVERVKLRDRPLIRVDADDAAWGAPDTAVLVSAGSIVWVKPGTHSSLEVAQLVARLKANGAHVKLLAKDHVDVVAITEREPAARELGWSDTREVVYQLCRELAPPAGVPAEDAVREVEVYLARAGL